MRSRDLAGQPRRRAWLTCPNCGERIVHGGPHQRRLIIGLVLWLAALALLALGYLRGPAWSVAGAIAAAIGVAWVAWCERRVFFIPYGG